MKGILLSIIFLLAAITGYSQYTISGKVVDKENKALEFATVRLLKDSSIITTTLTDSLGNYKIADLKTGHYSIGFSYINFIENPVVVDLINDITVNKQINDSSKANLQEVVVTARKPLIERKIDRLVFNVQNSISSIGADALEALSKTPGVKVSNNDISIIGKGAVSVMIDDRLIQLSGDDLANLLKSMSADDIASIEVITNPPAKYDAQGNSGLINIVLKKNARKGYTGNIRFGYTQATYAAIFGGGNINYNKGKFKLYGNVNVNNGSRQILYQRSIFYSTQTWSINDNNKNTATYLSGQAGIDFQASKNTLVGVSYNGSGSSTNIPENAVTGIYNKLETIDSTLITTANTDIHTHFNSANIYLKQSLGGGGKQLTINGDWLGYVNNQQRNFDNNSYDADDQFVPGSYSKYLSASRQTSDIYTLKADIDLPYKKYTIGFGSKLSFIKNKSNVSLSQLMNNVYEIDTAQTDQFNYTENTQALYFNINRTIKKWGFQLGMRGEYTQTTGTSISFTNYIQTNPPNNYFKIFPTVFISYNMNDKNVFSLNYGKRINRPGYWNLNPFRWYSNPYTYTEGNPFLQPAYNNNIELSYTYNNVFTTSLTFNDENDRFRQVTFVQNGSDTAVTKPLNFITGHTYLSNTSYTFNKIKWLESTETLCMYYNDSKSSLPQTLPTITGFGTWFETEEQFTLNKEKTFFAGLDFFYVFPAVEDINKNGSFYSLNLSFKALLANKKIQLSANLNDLFKSQISAVYTTINGIEQQQHNSFDTRRLRLTASYKFGNSKIKRQEHQAGNQDEQNRTN